jgi:hypothetical protein
MNRSIHEFDKLPQAREPVGVASRSGDAASDALKIGIIYNPRSHRNGGRDLDCAADPRIMVAQPEKREDIATALAEFAQAGIGYLIINGGDGTVRDVLTASVPVFSDDMPPVAVLPKGKTNALNVDLGAPKDWNVDDAIAAFDTGKRIIRRPIEVTSLDGESATIRGFILGAGAFTLGTQAGQGAHNLGFFNSLAVGAAGVWGVCQGLFGSDANPWRRGVEMHVVLEPAERPLPHSGHGDPSRRSIMLSSTLHNMPMGLKIFGPPRAGLKLAAMDGVRRRVMASLPFVMAGWQSDWLTKNGYHRAEADSFELTIGDQFIFDGEAFPAGKYRVAQGPELRFVIA